MTGAGKREKERRTRKEIDGGAWRRKMERERETEIERVCVRERENVRLDSVAQIDGAG